jgi:DNA polymerase-3 subunit gamma/tau
MVGQEAITLALTNAIRLRREPHSVIFTGVRGVGKTTTARIYAKALNCEQGPTAEPCDVCQSCLAIQDGTHEDVLEIDGASNTGVDDVRALQETLGYVPQRSTYKIYIIDEVHMLSISAFNALLKTLEEPPEHVVFIFATTELHKVPETIQSRCQTFHLQKISRPVISGRLGIILEAEAIAYEPEALAIVAREGRGSLRDALTLLDQVIALGGGQVSLAALQHAIGNSRAQPVLDLLVALLERQAKQAIEAIATWDQEGLSMSSLVEELAKTCRNAFILREWKGENLDLHILELEEKEQQTLLEIAQKSAPFDLNRLFRSFTKCLDDLRHADLDRYVVENYALEWCLDPGLPDLQQLAVPSVQDGRGGLPAAPRAQAAQDPGLGLKDRWKNQTPTVQRSAQAPATEPRPTTPSPMAASIEARSLASTLKDSLKTAQAAPLRSPVSPAAVTSPNVNPPAHSSTRDSAESNGTSVAGVSSVYVPPAATASGAAKLGVEPGRAQSSPPPAHSSTRDSAESNGTSVAGVSSVYVPPAATAFGEAKLGVEPGRAQSSPPPAATAFGEAKLGVEPGRAQSSHPPAATAFGEAKPGVEPGRAQSSPPPVPVQAWNQTQADPYGAEAKAAGEPKLIEDRSQIPSPAAALNLLAGHVSRAAREKESPKALKSDIPLAPTPPQEAEDAKAAAASADLTSKLLPKQGACPLLHSPEELGQIKDDPARVAPFADITPWDEKSPLQDHGVPLPLLATDAGESASKPILATPIETPVAGSALGLDPTRLEVPEAESGERFPASWREFIDEWKKQKPLQARVLEDTYVLEYGPDRIRLAVEQQSMAGAKLLQPDMRKRFLTQFEQLFGFRGQLDIIATTDVKTAAQEDAKPLGESLLEVKQREREIARDKLRKDLEQHPLTREVMAAFGGTIETIELT